MKLLVVTDEADAFNAQYNQACESGRFIDALNLVQGRMIDDALSWFAEAGVHFWRSEPGNQKENLESLAHAAHMALADLGDRAGSKQRVAQLALASLANLRGVVDRGPPQKPSDLLGWLAEIAVAAATLGSAEGMMVSERLGVFEKLGQLEFDRLRRRAGAEATNAVKASVRSRALAAALLIVSTNPTLSNEELALRVRTREGLSTTIRTIGDWVREWRRGGQLPGRKQT